MVAFNLRTALVKKVDRGQASSCGALKRQTEWINGETSRRKGLGSQLGAKLCYFRVGEDLLPVGSFRRASSLPHCHELLLVLSPRANLFAAQGENATVILPKYRWHYGIQYI